MLSGKTGLNSNYHTFCVGSLANTSVQRISGQKISYIRVPRYNTIMRMTKIKRIIKNVSRFVISGECCISFCRFCRFIFFFFLDEWREP